MPTTVKPDLGVISESESYPLPVFQQMAGLSNWALRKARQRGLLIRVVGRRKYVCGRDWAEYLATAPTETQRRCGDNLEA